MLTTTPAMIMGAGAQFVAGNDAALEIGNVVGIHRAAIEHVQAPAAGTPARRYEHSVVVAFTISTSTMDDPVA